MTVGCQRHPHPPTPFHRLGRGPIPLYPLTHSVLCSLHLALDPLSNQVMSDAFTRVIVYGCNQTRPTSAGSFSAPTAARPFIACLNQGALMCREPAPPEAIVARRAAHHNARSIRAV